MKKICVVVLMVALLSVVSPAFALIQAFRLGSVGQDSLDNVKTIHAAVNVINNYMTFEFPIGTDYQVTAGYTCYLSKVLFRSSTTGDAFVLGYGDTAVALGAAAPTNFVQVTEVFASANDTELFNFDIIVPIPAGKYPCMKSFAATPQMVRVQLYGVEIVN